MTRPIARGTALALMAAGLFGATAPIVKHFGVGVGAFSTASLLYTGALLGTGRPRRGGTDAAVTRQHAPRLLLVALLGAALAPTCLVWGIQHVGALTSSLLLNLEAVFTVALAWGIHGEPLGRRVTIASSLMLVGAMILGVRGVAVGQGELLGGLAVTLATLGWALDNTLTRPLSDLDPSAVVFWKALLGALLSALAAVVTKERWPSTSLSTLALLACGAMGYGVSLRFYLLAQRVIGTARTGSLFASGPLMGAALAFAAGERQQAPWILAASGLFGLAVWLHATEEHEHRHSHEPTVHEHSHCHDDGHHKHLHDPPAAGAHSHLHTHEWQEHTHPHGIDLHHRHSHP